jgi:hypothetical protein
MRRTPLHFTALVLALLAACAGTPQTPNTTPPNGTSPQPPGVPPSVEAINLPTITRFAPQAATVGTSVTFTGTNLTGARVQLGNVDATVTASSTSSLTVTVPGAATTAQWRVTTGAGNLTFPGQFTVLGTSSGATYYVSPTGNDNNPGNSPSSAWRTLGKASGATFNAGDKLLLEGGQTFAGTLTLPNVRGTAGNPVTIGSYGTGKATLNGGAGSGLVLRNAQNVVVQGLIAVGVGRKSGNRQGDGFNLENSSGVALVDLEASGFQRTGVRIFQSRDVRVVAVDAHDNGFSGIFADSGSTRNDNVYIGYSRATNNAGDPTITDNHSGNGILFYDTNNSLIEYSAASRNGWDQPLGPGNGPVGIWTARADRVTIQYCLSYNNDSTSADGGGFDFDGGTTNSLLQYSYAYGNKSYGLLFWEYGSNIGVTGNTARYNVFANNRGPSIFFGASGAGLMQGNQIYNNTAYSKDNAGVWYNRVSGDQPAQNSFRNNLFVAGNNAQILLGVPNTFRFEGNAYWRNDGSFDANGYRDLGSWANATGQETVGGSVVGVSADPRLSDPGNPSAITDPFLLSTLTAFTLRADSPLVNRALDLKARYGIDPGTRDYLGNPVPFGAAFDIGAYELQQAPSSTPPAPPPPAGNLFTNPGFESGFGGWQTQSASITGDQPHGGSSAARITGNGGLWRTVSVQPNTAYTLSGYLRASSGGSGVYLYVKVSGNETDSSTVTATAYTAASVTFNSGSAGSVEVGVWTGTTTGTADADDLELRAGGATPTPPAPPPPPSPPPSSNLLTNPGFESGLNAWQSWNAVPSNQAHTGTGASQITGTGGVYRTVAVQPNRTYTLSGFLKGDATNGAYLYVKVGANEVDSPTINAASYTATTLSFNSGAASSVELGVWKTVGAGNAYADDLELK